MQEQWKRGVNSGGVFGAEAVLIAGGAAAEAQRVTGRAEVPVGRAVKDSMRAAAGGHPVLELRVSPRGCRLDDIGVAQTR